MLKDMATPDSAPVVALEATEALVAPIIPVAEQSYLEFLILHPPTDDDKPKDTHSDYLRSKLDNITTLLLSKDEIIAPEITPEQIVERQKEGLDEEIEKPQFEDWSYLDYLALATEPKGENPYLTYLTVQEKYLNKLLTKNVTPVIAEIADISESTPLPDTKERNLLTKRLILAVTGILLIATGALVAHRFLFAESQINEATRAMQNELTRPALTAPLPDATHIHINTPMPTQPDTAPPTLTGSGEGGDDSPLRPTNEFIKYINPAQFDNDSQNTMPSDLYVLGGADGKQTNVIGMPNENTSNSLENFENPKYLLRFNPNKSRWERLTLSANKTINKISYRNNPNKTADGITIFYADGGSDLLLGTVWEYFDDKDPQQNQDELGKWSSGLVGAIETSETYYYQDPDRHIPLKTGSVIFSHH